MSTDNPIKSWIDERKAIHAAATDGPWYKTPNDRILSESVQWPEGDDYDVAGGFGCKGAVVEAIHDFDGNAIVDAHNVTVPTALSIVEAVLELHRAETTYQNVSECENEDEDHEDERHTESEDGTPICLDLPDYAACRSCQVDGEPVEWPCATVQAIEEAINDEPETDV